MAVLTLVWLFPAALPSSYGLCPGMSSVFTGASQKKGAVSYYFDFILCCLSLAALFDDQREEFSRVGSGV